MHLVGRPCNALFLRAFSSANACAISVFTRSAEGSIPVRGCLHMGHTTGR